MIYSSEIILASVVFPVCCRPAIKNSQFCVLFQGLLHRWLSRISHRSVLRPRLHIHTFDIFAVFPFNFFILSFECLVTLTQSIFFNFFWPVIFINGRNFLYGQLDKKDFPRISYRRICSSHHSRLSFIFWKARQMGSPIIIHPPRSRLLKTVGAMELKISLSSWGRTKVERRQLRHELKNRTAFRP